MRTALPDCFHTVHAVHDWRWLAIFADMVGTAAQNVCVGKF